MVIKKVYDDEFAPVHPMLAALRSNRPDIIAKYDDLLMPEIEAKMLSIIGNLNESLPDKSEQIRSSDDAKTKRLLALLAQMDIPSDIAIPMVDDVLRKHPDLPITALINKVTAYSVAEEKTSPKISIIKHSEWSSLPSDDLRYLYVSSQKNKVYEEFKKHGLVFNLQSLLH